MTTQCDLTAKKCVPCEGGALPLEQAKIDGLLAEVKGWAQDGKQIKKRWKFGNFVEAMAFVNKVADVAETEGHHPDIFIHYSEVTLNLWTHAIGGLSENDFIVAAKVDAI